MFRKIMTVAVLGTSLTIAACNTVRGVGRDVQSVANCTEDMMKRGQC